MKYLIEIHHGIGDVVQMTGVWETLYRMDKDADIGVIINLYGRYELLRNDRRIKHIYLLNIHDMPKVQILKPEGHPDFCCTDWGWDNSWGTVFR